MEAGGNVDERSHLAIWTGLLAALPLAGDQPAGGEHLQGALHLQVALLHLDQQPLHRAPAPAHVAALDVRHLGRSEDGGRAPGVRCPASGREVWVCERGIGAAVGRQVAHLDCCCIVAELGVFLKALWREAMGAD